MKTVLLIGLPAACLVGLIGWRYSQKQETLKVLAQTSNSRRNGAVNVATAVAASGDLVQSVQEVGTVQSPFMVNLSPKLTGKITYLELREGASVKKGQLLCQVNPTETEGQVLQARSALAQAQYQLVNAKYLQKPSDEAVKSNIRQAEETINSNKADWKQVKDNLEAQVAQAQSGVLDSQAKLDSAKSAVANAKASRKSADASFADADSKYKRENTLYKQGFVAAQDVDDALAAQKVAAANVNVAQGQVNAAVSAQASADAELKQAEYNKSIVQKTGQTNIDAAYAKVKLAIAARDLTLSQRANVPAYQAQLTALKSAVAAAEGNLNQALARLADCNLVSSIDGTITSRNADPGMVVNSGTAILQIQYLKWLFIQSAVPVEYSNQVTVGSPVRVVFDALPDGSFNGKVEEVNRVADPQNRQFMIRLKMDNSNGKLRPGMYAQVFIQLSKTHHDVVVPREAVKTGNDGKSTVTVVDSGNVAHVVNVKPGEQDTNHTAIDSGLEPGSRVVVISYTPVRDKQKVVEGTPGGSKGRNKGGSKAGAGDNATPQFGGISTAGSSGASATQNTGANETGQGQSKGSP